MKRPLLCNFPPSRAWVLYLLGAILSALLAVGSVGIDQLTGTGELFAVIANILLAAVLFLSILISGGVPQLAEGSLLSRYLPLVLLMPAFTLVMSSTPLHGTLPLGETALWLLGLLAEAVWEELFFRHTALRLFGRKAMFSIRVIAFTALVFGGRCMINALFVPVSAALAESLFTACVGVFLTALYLRTKHILVPVLAHFLMDFCGELFLRLSGSSASFPYDFLSSTACGALLLVIGGILLFRGRRKEFGPGADTSAPANP